ncbi:asparagine-rich antigen, putative [Plasmodium vinckei vinckei]|uniref:Asparagine-rich antigen, putative n=1 Tax=Plasmodium vinckei vinckei TaxID=54757 RepID=A0A449BQL3_PLAVN|nr:asparagine-rich antigen, putative [Plasmodium vinckei vinckei]VEV55757.1 asparagine-rich antigen, putative [Plasmodium vinckei vinckei]
MSMLGYSGYEQCEGYSNEKNEYSIEKQETNEGSSILSGLSNKEVCGKLSDDESGKSINDMVSENKEGDNYLENSYPGHINMSPKQKDEYGSSKSSEIFNTYINNGGLDNKCYSQCETNNYEENNFYNYENNNIYDGIYNTTIPDNDAGKSIYDIDKYILLNISANLGNREKISELNGTKLYTQESITSMDRKNSDIANEATAKIHEENLSTNKSINYEVKKEGDNKDGEKEVEEDVEKDLEEDVEKDLEEDVEKDVEKDIEKSNNTGDNINNPVIEIDDSLEEPNGTDCLSYYSKNSAPFDDTHHSMDGNENNLPNNNNDSGKWKSEIKNGKNYERTEKEKNEEAGGVEEMPIEVEDDEGEVEKVEINEAEDMDVEIIPIDIIDDDENIIKNVKKKKSSNKNGNNGRGSGSNKDKRNDLDLEDDITSILYEHFKSIKAKVDVYRKSKKEKMVRIDKIDSLRRKRKKRRLLRYRFERNKNGIFDFLVPCSSEYSAFKRCEDIGLVYQHIVATERTIEYIYICSQHDNCTGQIIIIANLKNHRVEIKATGSTCISFNDLYEDKKNVSGNRFRWIYLDTCFGIQEGKSRATSMGYKYLNSSVTGKRYVRNFICFLNNQCSSRLRVVKDNETNKVWLELSGLNHERHCPFYRGITKEGILNINRSLLNNSIDDAKSAITTIIDKYNSSKKSAKNGKSKKQNKKLEKIKKEESNMLETQQNEMNNQFGNNVNNHFPGNGNNNFPGNGNNNFPGNGNNNFPGNGNNHFPGNGNNHFPGNGNNNFPGNGNNNFPGNGNNNFPGNGNNNFPGNGNNNFPGNGNDNMRHPTLPVQRNSINGQNNFIGNNSYPNFQNMQGRHNMMGGIPNGPPYNNVYFRQGSINPEFNKNLFLMQNCRNSFSANNNIPNILNDMNRMQQHGNNFYINGHGINNINNPQGHNYMDVNNPYLQNLHNRVVKMEPQNQEWLENGNVGLGTRNSSEGGSIRNTSNINGGSSEQFETDNKQNNGIPNFQPNNRQNIEEEMGCNNRNGFPEQNRNISDYSLSLSCGNNMNSIGNMINKTDAIRNFVLNSHDQRFIANHIYNSPHKSMYINGNNPCVVGSNGFVNQPTNEGESRNISPDIDNKNEKIQDIKNGNDLEQVNRNGEDSKEVESTNREIPQIGYNHYYNYMNRHNIVPYEGPNPNVHPSDLLNLNFYKQENSNVLNRNTDQGLFRCSELVENSKDGNKSVDKHGLNLQGVYENGNTEMGSNNLSIQNQEGGSDNHGENSIQFFGETDGSNEFKENGQVAICNDHENDKTCQDDDEQMHSACSTVSRNGSSVLIRKISEDSNCSSVISVMVSSSSISNYSHSSSSSEIKSEDRNISQQTETENYEDDTNVESCNNSRNASAENEEINEEGGRDKKRKHSNEMNYGQFENSFDNNVLKRANSTYMQENMNNYMLQQPYNVYPNNNSFFNNGGSDISGRNNNVGMDVNNFNDDDPGSRFRANINGYNYACRSSSNMNMYDIKNMHPSMYQNMGNSNYGSTLNVSNGIYNEGSNFRMLNSYDVVNGNVYMGRGGGNYFRVNPFNGNPSNIHNINEEMYNIGLRNIVGENTVAVQTNGLQNYQPNSNISNINNLHNDLYMQNIDMSNAYNPVFSNMYNHASDNTRFSINGNNNNNNYYQYMNEHIKNNYMAASSNQSTPPRQPTSSSSTQPRQPTSSSSNPNLIYDMPNNNNNNTQNRYYN